MLLTCTYYYYYYYYIIIALVSDVEKHELKVFNTFNQLYLKQKKLFLLFHAYDFKASFNNDKKTNSNTVHAVAAITCTITFYAFTSCKILAKSLGKFDLFPIKGL